MQGHEKLYGSMTPYQKGRESWEWMSEESSAHNQAHWAEGSGNGEDWGPYHKPTAKLLQTKNTTESWVLSPDWPLSLSLFIGNEKNGQRSKPAHVNVTHSQSLKTLTPVHRHTTRFAHLRSSGTVCVRSACHVPLSHSVSARVGNCTSLESLSVKIF